MNDWAIVKEVIQEAYNLDDRGMEFFMRKPVVTVETLYKDDFMPIINSNHIGGWLGRYIEYTMGVEPPTAYHFAMGLTILGAALHRQVWFDQVHFKVYPAVQSFLIGPSGITRKSTAANIGIGIAQESGRVHRLPDMATPEAILKELAELSREGGASALVYSSELSTFMNKKDYNQDLVQVLTDLFDSRDYIKRRTMGGGPIEIKNVAVSAVLCSNEVWMGTSVHESAMGGGLMGRSLVWHQFGTDRYFPFPEEPPIGMYKRMVNDLGLTRYFHGEANITPDAREWYKRKYRYIKDNWPKDERLVPFWERYAVHLLRVAMLIDVSDKLETQSREVTVSHTNLLQADAVLQWIYKKLPGVYAHLGNTRWGSDAMTVYTYIMRQGGKCNWGKLARAFNRRVSGAELKAIVDSFVSNGVMRKRSGQKWSGGALITIEREWT
jgi:hypothetical protein